MLFALIVACCAVAETPVESSLETRFQLDLRVPESALASFLPHGFTPQGNPADVRFYSAKMPTFFQISRQEQVLDILRNVTTHPPDRVKEFSFKAGGGTYAKLFDGTEKPLSWDNILWIQRTVLMP